MINCYSENLEQTYDSNSLIFTLCFIKPMWNNILFFPVKQTDCQNNVFIQARTDKNLVFCVLFRAYMDITLRSGILETILFMNSSGKINRLLNIKILHYWWDMFRPIVLKLIYSRGTDQNLYTIIFMYILCSKKFLLFFSFK